MLAELNPNVALSMIEHLEPDERQRVISRLDDGLQFELRDLMTFPEDSAGRLMDTRVGLFRPSMTVEQAFARLRESKLRGLSTVFVVDDENRLSAKIAIHDLAVADTESKLADLAEPVGVSAQATAPRSEVIEMFESSPENDRKWCWVAAINSSIGFGTKLSSDPSAPDSSRTPRSWFTMEA